jgi:hypothetical protein
MHKEEALPLYSKKQEAALTMAYFLQVTFFFFKKKKLKYFGIGQSIVVKSGLFLDRFAKVINIPFKKYQLKNK